jgi:hypothetical protein
MTLAYRRSMPVWDIIDQLLGSGTPPPAVLSGLRSLLYEHAGYETSQDPKGVTDLLGHLLRLRPGPFTALADAITGTGTRVDRIAEPAERRITGAQAEQLGVPDSPTLTCVYMRGFMMAGTTVVAEVELDICPAQIGDDEAVELIRKGVPCGAVLPGLTREYRRALECWPMDPALVSRAILHRDGRRFGFAAERVDAGFIRRIAEMAPPDLKARTKRE